MKHNISQIGGLLINSAEFPESPRYYFDGVREAANGLRDGIQNATFNISALKFDFYFSEGHSVDGLIVQPSPTVPLC